MSEPEGNEQDLEREQARLRRLRVQGDAEIEDEELRNLVELSTDLLAITDFDGYFRLLNPAWETALGWSREELRSKPFIEFVHPDDRDKTEVTAERLRPGVELLAFQNRYICKDGSIKSLRWKAMVSTAHQRYYSVTHDMTDQLRSREQQGAFEALCELSAEAIIMQDGAGIITHWNAAAEMIFNQPASEIVGRQIRDLLGATAGDRIDLLALFEQSDDDRIAARWVGADGSSRPIVAAVRPFGDSDRPITGAIATLTPN